MGDIDFEKLLKAASSEKAAKNAMTFTDLLTEAEKVVKLGEKVVSIFDRAGALPGMVRALGKKYDVDVETPLRTREHSNAIDPISSFHQEVMLQLNSMDEDRLRTEFEKFARILQNESGTGTAQSETGSD